MKIQTFDGGINSRLRPQMIKQNEAVVYSNIDNEKGTLVPVAAKTDAGILTDRFAHFYHAKQKWVSSNTYRDYVEFEKILYYTDRVGRPQKYNGSTTRNLGISKPNAPPTVTATSISDAPTEADLVPSTAGDMPASVQNYILVNDNGVYFSEPLKLSIDLTSFRTQILLDDNDLNFGRVTFGTERIVSTVATGLLSVHIQNVKGPTYGVNGIKVYRLYGQKYYLVGSLANDAAVLNDTVYDITANDEFDETNVAPVAGLVQYVYTFYNSSDGTESAPSSPSPEQQVLSAISLTDLQISSDPQVNKKRIYRVGGFITTFSLVAEISNTTTTYSDTVEDVDIIGTVLTASNNVEAPIGLSFLTEAYSMLFGAEDTKLRFTPIGEPNYWSEFFFLQFDSPITGIAPTTNGLIVLTEFKAFVVTGTGPTVLSVYPLRGDQGCIDASSIQLIGGAAVWASTDGICTSNGSEVRVITKEKLGKISLSPVDSVLHDEVYYLLETDGSILAIDARYGQVVKRLSLGVTALAVANDVLYGYSGTTQHKLFSSSSFESLNYTSPRFIEGASSEEKQYKKVYIYSKGDIIINIIIDDVIVATKILTTEGSHQIQVPNSKQRGHFIQFSISGTGEVYEYEYKTGRRKLD